MYIDVVAAAPAPSRLSANLVHFMPGARTHWHRHPLSQTVFVTEGVGLCQRRGGPVEIIRPGDRVLFEADEEHWHGAAPNRLMVHVAINEGDDQHDVVHWLDPVTDTEYEAAPAAICPPRQPLRRIIRRRLATVSTGNTGAGREPLFHQCCKRSGTTSRPKALSASIPGLLLWAILGLNQ